MKKTNELRDALSKTFADRKNWNRRIEVAGECYVYCSAKNEIRRIDQRGGLRGGSPGRLLRARHIRLVLLIGGDTRYPTAGLRLRVRRRSRA